MAWKCKLLSLADEKVTVQFYESGSGRTREESYPIDRFATKAELRAYVNTIVDELNVKLAKYDQLQVVLTNSIGNDL